MTLDTIYSEISAHFLEGLMIHNKLMETFYFLGCYGYGDFHKKQYIDESKNYAKLAKYFISRNGKLIHTNQVSDPYVDSYAKIYPFTYDQFSTEQIKSLITRSIDEWVKWETSTKYFLNDKISELIKMGENADAEFISIFLTDVDKELDKATKLRRMLINTDYDMTYIMENQKEE